MQRQAGETATDNHMPDESAFTLAELYAHRRKLNELIWSGTIELRFGDRWEKFAPHGDLVKGLALLEAEITSMEAAAGSTTLRVRRVRVYQDSDFD